MTKTLVVIMGPTAVGKTSLSIELAQLIGAEIISADSRQFYQEISIGTAKATKEERASVPHHFLDFLELESDYSAGQFERDALLKIESLFQENEYVIMCGGSGLFLRAVCEGLDETPRDLVIREDLNARHKSDGLESLVKELAELDPEALERVDLKNPQRIIRALEVCLASAKPYSSFLHGTKKERPFKILKIGLRRERKELYERIEQRTELMMNEGWVEECQNVIGKRELNSLNTVGYKEIFQYLDGNMTLEECIKLIKQHTRNFAKRQMTWFKSDEHIHWIDLPKGSAVKEIRSLLN